MRRRRRVKGCHRPKDDAEVGVAPPRAHRGASGRGGEYLFSVVLLWYCHLTPPCCHCRRPLAKPQINFESRLVDDALNDCTMSIDGTDFRIQQKGVHEKGNAWGSHKYAGKSAVRYELGIDIFKGNLVWVQGPYPAGAWPDIKIFMDCLAGHLLPGERVEADNGYVGHPDKIKCPNNPGNPKRNLGMQAATRSRHETFNGRLKNWGILERTYRHDVRVHGIVFTACAVITQLCVANGEPLFEVEYGDDLNDEEEDDEDDDEEEDEDDDKDDEEDDDEDDDEDE